jgi:hypothetical protein
MLAKFREAFAPSGKKDDPADAQLLLELVSKHQENRIEPFRGNKRHSTMRCNRDRNFLKT